MIDVWQFESIKQKYGGYASWAVWVVATEGKPKSNIGDMSIFDLNSDPTLLGVLKNDVVMVGLNISRPLLEPFRNFHDPDPRANDFKIRYAFQNTEYYGAYMTDIIKDLATPDSRDVLKALKDDARLIEKNVERFREELRDLKSERPTILAFGASAHNILSESIGREEYSALVKLTHYSHYISKEKYKDEVLGQINVALE